MALDLCLGLKYPTNTFQMFSTLQDSQIVFEHFLERHTLIYIFTESLSVVLLIYILMSIKLSHFHHHFGIFD